MSRISDGAWVVGGDPGRGKLLGQKFFRCDCTLVLRVPAGDDADLVAEAVVGHGGAVAVAAVLGTGVGAAVYVGDGSVSECHEVVDCLPGADRVDVADDVDRAAGDATALRPEITGNDVPLLLLMIGEVAQNAQGFRPDLGRRYLRLILDGLRTRPDTTDLGDPMDDDELERFMRGWGPAPR